MRSPPAIIFGIVALSLLGAGPAFSQVPPYDYPITVGTAQVQVLAADNARRRLVFSNPNATAIVAVCPSLSRVNSAPITCAINGAGSVTLLPYASFTVDGVGQNGAIPSPWNAIASAPGSALSILEFE
jgi:hypothetical protein